MDLLNAFSAMLALITEHFDPTLSRLSRGGSLSFPALKDLLQNIFPAILKRRTKLQIGTFTLEEVMKQRQLEIAPSDAIFVYKISAARVQLKSGY